MRHLQNNSQLLHEPSGWVDFTIHETLQWGLRRSVLTGMVFVMRKRTRPPATTATQTSTYANQVLYDIEALVLKLPFGYQVVLTTPTVKLALNALAINVVLWRLALTMLPATTGKPPQSVILKTLHTQPASTVREGNANQVGSSLIKTLGHLVRLKIIPLLRMRHRCQLPQWLQLQPGSYLPVPRWKGSYPVDHCENKDWLF